MSGEGRAAASAATSDAATSDAAASDDAPAAAPTSAASGGPGFRRGAPGPADALALCVAAPALSLWAAGMIGFEATQALGGDLAMLSRLTGLAFAGLAALCAATLLRAGRGLRRQAVQGAGQGAGAGGCAWGLAALMLLGAALAVGHNRGDFDDAYYLGNVVHALAHPGDPISDEVRALAARPLAPFQSRHWATATGFDHLAASLGRWTGLHALDIRYLVLPGLAGATLVAGLFLLLREFVEEAGEALLAAFFVTALLVIWRDAHRAFGNFAFVRLYQSKAVAMTVLAPLFCAGALRFLRAPSILAGGGLALIAAAGAGLSTTVVLLFAASGLGLFIGLAALRPGEGRPGVARRLVLRGLAAAALCAPLAPLLLRVAQETLPLGYDSPANDGWPRSFAGHAAFMGASTFLVILVGGVVLALSPGRRESRRLVLVWGAAILVLFLNPLTGDRLIRHAVGPNVYWRLFYALPWIPLAGLAFLGLFEGPAARLRRRRAWLPVLLLAVGLPGTAALDAALGHAPVWPPGWKLSPAARAEAEAILEAGPPGPMLAPRPVSRIIVILDGNRPQLRLRRDGLAVWAQAAGAPGLARRRSLAVELLGGTLDPADPQAAEAAAEALDAVLEESAPASVVLAAEAPGAATARRVLSARGYAQTGRSPRHEIWAP